MTKITLVGGEKGGKGKAFLIRKLILSKIERNLLEKQDGSHRQKIEPDSASN